MKYAKYEAGLGRKGIAICSNGSTTQSNITVGTDLVAFVNVTSTTDRISKVSNTAVLLRAGSTYYLEGCCVPVASSSSLVPRFGFYNLTAGQAIGVTNDFGAYTWSGNNAGGMTMAYAVITPTVDTQVSFRCIAMFNTTGTLEIDMSNRITVTIHEVEQFSPKSISALYCRQAEISNENTSLPFLRLKTSTTAFVTSAQFGSRLPIYLTSFMPCIGFNAYNDGTSWRFGAMSNSNYGGCIDYGGTNGEFNFRTSSSPGNEGEITSFTTILSAGANFLRSMPVYNSTTTMGANVYVDGSGQLMRSTSSIKYKKDVEDLSREYSQKIYQLRPVWYRSKNEGDKKEWSWYGLIAEEVAEIEPRLVQFSHNGEPEGVDYARLSVLLLKEIQELRKEVDELKNKKKPSKLKEFFVNMFKWRK